MAPELGALALMLPLVDLAGLEPATELEELTLDLFGGQIRWLDPAQTHARMMAAAMSRSGT